LTEIGYYDIVVFTMSDFNHAAHLRLALDCLTRAPSFDAAAAEVAAILRGMAEAAGHPEKYHQTLTLFWMRMVARLLDKNLPLAYYSPERLSSDAARTSWLDPDLQAIDHASIGSPDSPGDTPHWAVSR
jgi:hypothetical protein